MPRRKAAKREAKPKHEFWASIDERCKPSAATSSDDMRPVLRYGWIYHDKGGCWLCATDSYIFLRLPVTLHTRTAAEKRTLAQRRRLLPEVMLTPEAMKALDRSGTGRFRVKDGILRVQDQPSIAYPLPRKGEVGTPPDARRLLDPLLDGGRPLERVAFDVRLLRRLEKAIGARGVRLLFIDHLRPIRVQALSGANADAILMPIRDVATDG